MTIAKSSNRQGIISARVEVHVTDLVGVTVEESQTIAFGALTSGVAYSTTLALPVGAVVLGGELTVVTPFDSATSDVLDVGDATTGNRYLNDADLQSAGDTPLVPTGFVATASQPVIKVTWVGVGAAPSTGSFTLTVRYATQQVVEVLDLPPGAYVLGGSLAVNTAFDSGTSDAIDVGDSLSNARYASAVDGQVEAVTSLLTPGYRGDSVYGITMKLNHLGADPSVGTATLQVNYIVDKRAEFSQN